MREKFRFVIMQRLSLQARAAIFQAIVFLSSDLFLFTERAVPWLVVATFLALLKLRQVVEVLAVVLVLAIIFLSALPFCNLGDGIKVD